MIYAISSIKEMNVAIRSNLVIHSELPATHVLSSESLRGTNLTKQKTKDVWESFTTDDSIIVYDMSERESGDDLIEQTEDGLLNYASYSYHITVYGDDSHILARKVKARFLTEEVILSLEKVGIHIQNISAIESGDEFINNTHWHRKDFNINISVRFNFDKKTSYQSYDDLDGVDITVKE